MDRRLQDILKMGKLNELLVPHETVDPEASLRAELSKERAEGLKMIEGHPALAKMRGVPQQLEALIVAADRQLAGFAKRYAVPVAREKSSKVIASLLTTVKTLLASYVKWENELRQVTAGATLKEYGVPESAVHEARIARVLQSAKTMIPTDYIEACLEAAQRRDAPLCRELRKHAKYLVATNSKVFGANSGNYDRMMRTIELLELAQMTPLRYAQEAAGEIADRMRARFRGYLRTVEEGQVLDSAIWELLLGDFTRDAGEAATDDAKRPKSLVISGSDPDFNKQFLDNVAGVSDGSVRVD